MKKLALAFSGISFLALAACSSTSGGVSLATVEAESKAITTAVDTLAPALIAVLPAASQAQANTALKAFDAAEASLVAGTYTSPKAGVEAFLSATQAVVSVVPLPANTEVAIQAGLGLAEAFVNVLPISATVSTVTPSVPFVAGPVPIPLK